MGKSSKYAPGSPERMVTLPREAGPNKLFAQFSAPLPSSVRYVIKRAAMGLPPKLRERK
jgi:hypothetical protein